MDVSTPKKRSEKSPLRQQPFTPLHVNRKSCMARTWNHGLGGQCSMLRKAGEDFCKIHLEKWSLHGRVDGAVPEGKLREFEAALVRCPRASAKRSYDDPAWLQSPVRKSSRKDQAPAPAPLPKYDLQSCMDSVPGVCGKLAQFIWSTERLSTQGRPAGRQRVCPDLFAMLQVGRTTRLAMIASVKDGRRFASMENSKGTSVVEYQSMCDILQKVCNTAWTESRTLRLALIVGTYSN
eukprot:TRINITY_DN16458_c0_g3_i2.p1 TRINITY_DN16458_c0_g3~~TRINITY_DN16458_c0_g3_i2.p1  ORF type:complete len:255 (+),score=32.82 TRINITY_DN16458_c0_g3_i2:58-765(+)